MERQSDFNQHEEAIVPVRPGLGTASASGSSKPAPEGRRRVPASAMLGLAAAVLLATAIGVFFVLPDVVEQRAARPAPAVTGPAAAPQPVAPAAPALTEEQIAQLTDEVDALLAQLLTQQQELTSLSVASWGEQDWERYQALSRAGDDAYLDAAYQAAISTYSEALAVGESLLERSEEITARALEAGQRALEAGNASLAMQQFDLVLSVDEGNEAALAGRARAERLPEALAATRRGDELRQSDQLAEAAEAYRQALEIDGAWAPARSSLEAVERLIAQRRYETVMSEGYRALGEERYADADERFRAALAMRPGSTEARDGTVQAEQGMHLDQIALAEARALAFERRELWQQAIQQYQAALETDDSLAFAKEGLERVRERADLDIKLENLIENPNLLFGDAVLASAQALLQEARSLVGEETPEEGGNVRLAQQIDKLTNLIALASTPVRVVLRSDQLTQVTLFRVGVLGSFTATEVELRPGNYTAVGSRDGYRDVRRTFTVLPGRELEPISVICEEPI